MLMRYLIEEAKKKGIKILKVEVVGRNVPFYEKLGFVRLKEEQDVGGIRFIPMALKVQSDIITDGEGVQI